MREYVNWYENWRLHQGLEGKCPMPHKEGMEDKVAGTIVSIPFLGGLHHGYERVAA